MNKVDWTEKLEEHQIWTDFQKEKKIIRNKKVTGFCLAIITLVKQVIHVVQYHGSHRNLNSELHRIHVLGQISLSEL